MSKRKNGLILVLILVLCLLLLGQLMGDTYQVSPSNPDFPENPGLLQIPEDAVDSEPVELNAVVFMGPEEMQLMRLWNEKYELEHPGVTIALTNIAKQQAFSYLIGQMEAGTGPDIVLLENIWVNHFAARGMLTYAAADTGTADGRQAQPQVERQLVWNGYVWAVPRDMDPYVAVVNWPVLDSGGIAALPDNAANWADVYNDLKARGLDPAIAIDRQDPASLLSAVWAMGGDWSLDENGMIRLDPESGQVLEVLLGWSGEDDRADPAEPIVRPVAAGEIWRGFDEGRYAAAVVRLSDWLLGGTGEETVAAALTGSKAAGLWFSGTSYAVTSSSGHASEAFRWISAMTGTEQLLRLMPVTGTLPSYAAALDSVEVRALPQWDNIEQAVQSQRVLIADPRAPLKLDLIRQEWERLLLGETASIAEWNDRLSRRWLESR